MATNSFPLGQQPEPWQLAAGELYADAVDSGDKAMAKKILRAAERRADREGAAQRAEATRRGRGTKKR